MVSVNVQHLVCTCSTVPALGELLGSAWCTELLLRRELSILLTGQQLFKQVYEVICGVIGGVENSSLLVPLYVVLS